MKKINITSLALLAYLIVMSLIGWPGGKYGQMTYTEYFIMIGVTLVVIILLRIMQIKRMKTREKWKQKNPEE